MVIKYDRHYLFSPFQSITMHSSLMHNMTMLQALPTCVFGHIVPGVWKFKILPRNVSVICCCHFYKLFEYPFKSINIIITLQVTVWKEVIIHRGTVGQKSRSLIAWALAS